MRIFIPSIILIVPAICAHPAFAQKADNPMIDAARGRAMEFAASAPDYIVKRTTIRYQGSYHPDVVHLVYDHWQMPAVVDWDPIDAVTMQLAIVNKKESYSNIAVNGTPMKDLPEGSWSTGEFAVTLLEILSPESATTFTHQREETIRKRPAYRFDYSVDREHSTLSITAGPFSWAPAIVHYTSGYGGTIWIDRETGQVLRIEQTARGLPDTFPLETVTGATDYDYVQIGGRQYCLPVHSEAVNCSRRLLCWRNVTSFTHYDKFGSQTSIQFEGVDSGK